MMETILGLLTGGSAGIYAAVAGIIAVIGGAVTLYLKGRADAKAKADIARLQEWANTRERIDNAKTLDAGKPDDIAAARKRLRDTAK
jgi:hypothetical protein